jgi:hypothetical protein
MPEQLKASAAIMGAGLKNVALVTDGRYSGARYAHPSTCYLPLTDNRIVMDLSSDSKSPPHHLATYAQIFLPIFLHIRLRRIAILIPLLVSSQRQLSVAQLGW